MRILTFCSAFLLTTYVVGGQNPDSTQQLAAIGTFENPIAVSEGDSVKFFVGQVVSIKGLVVNAAKTHGKDGTIGFLNLFKPYPENPFSVVIYRQYLAFFDPLEQFEKKKVRIKGKVNAYKDKNTGNDRYSIQLRKPEQIEILPD